MPIEQVVYVACQWASPVAVVISATIGGYIAVTSIKSARELARKKSSIDLILDSKHDDNLEKGLNVIREIHSNPKEDIVKFAYPEMFKVEQNVDIRYVLNYNEFVAIGIREGIYDERIIKNATHRITTKSYEMCEKYIEKVRDDVGVKTIWCEYEALYKRWKDSPPDNPNSRTK